MFRWDAVPLASCAFELNLSSTYFVPTSVEIKEEPTEDENITENGQAKEEDDSKEAGELVS